MTVVMQTDILVSLQALHGDVQRRFAELDRYRALKAIERTIADFPGLDDVADSLGDIRDRVQQQLDGTREFRALRSIERMLPELSEVLVLLDGPREIERNPMSGDPAFGSESLASESAVDGQSIAASHSAPHADLDAGTQSPFETVTVDIETVVLAAAPEQPQEEVADPSHGRIPDWTAATTTDDRPPPGPEIDPRTSEAAHVPSLADSVAQLMAQAAVPPRDPPAPPDWSAGTDAPERPQSQAERAA